MSESKGLEKILNEVRNTENREQAELLLIAVLAGAVKSEILLLKATISYMLEDGEVEEEIIDGLNEKLAERQEILAVIRNIVRENY